MEDYSCPGAKKNSLFGSGSGFLQHEWTYEDRRDESIVCTNNCTYPLIEVQIENVKGNTLLAHHISC